MSRGVIFPKRDRGSDRGLHDSGGTSIAIVGGGPRGLYCLQSLLDEIREPGSPIDHCSITVFEPASSLGAGNIYDPKQPHYLRMNFAARHIDVWPRDDHEKGTSRLTLVEWLDGDAPSRYGEHSFVPRALVGRYLHECYRLVEEELRKCVNYRVVPERVEAIEPGVDGWKVRHGAACCQCDEVVLTVGHEGWRGGPVSDDALPIIPTFPTARQLSTSQIPAGSLVGVRGFGLTWIDTALALTEGRGGEFDCHAGNWRYHRTGEEPRKILPFSRTGRPMLAKPDETRFPQPRELDPIWAAGRDRLLKMASPGEALESTDPLWETIQTAAAEALRVLNGSDVRLETIQSWFEEWIGAEMSPERALTTMRTSCRVETGQSPPDIGWALGAAWRNLYPALVSVVSHGGLAAIAWTQFHKIACEMERIAFGPPAENLGRILALEEADIVDLKFLLGDIRSLDSRLVLSSGDKEIRLNSCVNAVIPSPREFYSGGPLQCLLDHEMICRLEGANGICVDRAGRPLKNGRRMAETLAIFGRATEDCVLGNDTLSRKLHDHPVRWAQEVVARMRTRKDFDVGG